MKPILCALFCLSLTACGPVVETTDRVANNIKADAHATAEHMEKWFAIPRKQSPRPVPTTYCYKAQTDVLCYRQPMPGWEHRLVGYQGTGAEPPPPATMQVLKTASGSPETPAMRVAGAQPVFIEPPPEIQGSDSSAMPVADTAHEVLPDPAMSPQL